MTPAQASALAQGAIRGGLTPRLIEMERARGREYMLPLAAHYGLTLSQLRVLLDRWPIAGMGSGAGAIVDCGAAQEIAA